MTFLLNLFKWSLIIFGFIFFATIFFELTSKFALKLLSLRKVANPSRYTMLDPKFDDADSLKSCEWYPEYKAEAINIFFHHIWSPFTYWKSPRYNGKFININKNNLRKTWNKNFNHEKSENIFFFGGSTGWGWGARDDYTIPSLLAKLLSEENSFPIYMENHAQVGHVSTQEVIALFKLLQLPKSTKPKIVIFYDGLNDAFSAFQNRAAGVSLNEYVRKAEFESSMWQKIGMLINKYSSLSHLIVNYFMKNVNKNFSILNYPKRMSQVCEDVLNIYFSNIKIVKALGDYFGFKSLFYWQPLIFSKKNLTPFEKNLYEISKYWEKFYNEIKVKLSSGLDKVDNFHDISDLFLNHSDPFYIDPWHINENGNQIIAKRIFNDVQLLFNQNNIDNYASKAGLRLSA